jgi:hypothetical protein
MNRQTELALLDWGRRVNATILSISPPSGAMTPSERRSSAINTSLKSTSKQLENLEALKAYLEFAEEVLIVEEMGE